MGEDGREYTGDTTARDLTGIHDPALHLAVATSAATWDSDHLVVVLGVVVVVTSAVLVSTTASANGTHHHGLLLQHHHFWWRGSGRGGAGAAAAPTGSGGELLPLMRWLGANAVEVHAEAAEISLANTAGRAPVGLGGLVGTGARAIDKPIRLGLTTLRALVIAEPSATTAASGTSCHGSLDPAARAVILLLGNLVVGLVLVAA